MAKNRPSYVSKPVYPGGITAMRKFIAENLKYPDQAKAAMISGTVTIRYSLDYRGKVVGAKVKKGLGYGCDEEALRVVKMMRFNVPQDRKKKVRVHQDINIHFKLPQPKPAPAPAPTNSEGSKTKVTSATMTISYVTTSDKVKQTPGKEVPEERKSSTYGYTIKW